MPSPRTEPLSGSSARRWAQHTAQRLADWGHGQLAPAAEGGICIAGLANVYGCCWVPLPLYAATATVCRRLPMQFDGEKTRCANCGQEREITRWAQWQGPGADEVAAVLRHGKNSQLNPSVPWPAQDAPASTRRHWLLVEPAEMRDRRGVPLRKARRDPVRWGASGLPSPDMAIKEAEVGRGAAQIGCFSDISERCAVELDTLVDRRNETGFELVLAMGNRVNLELCVEENLGRTMWEPELVVGDDPGVVSAVWLSPVNDRGEPIAPAAVPAHELGRANRAKGTRGDEAHWGGEVCTFGEGHVRDVDPVLLATACIPTVELRRVASCRRDLRDAWADAMSGERRIRDNAVPDWLIEGVQQRIAQRVPAAAHPSTERDAQAAQREMTGRTL